VLFKRFENVGRRDIGFSVVDQLLQSDAELLNVHDDGLR
jgi:hypothetical protein